MDMLLACGGWRPEVLQAYNAQNSPTQQRVIQPPKVNSAKGGKPWFKLIGGKLNIEQGISGLAEGFIFINWNDFSYH